MVESKNTEPYALARFDPKTAPHFLLKALTQITSLVSLCISIASAMLDQSGDGILLVRGTIKLYSNFRDTRFAVIG